MDDIEIGMTQDDDFVVATYNIVLEACRREKGGGCYSADFYFQMIPFSNSWWMAADHPVAIMLTDNKRLALAQFKGPHGEVVVFSDENVKECVKFLVEQCEEKLSNKNYYYFISPPSEKPPVAGNPSDFPSHMIPYMVHNAGMYMGS